jgi:hypothetical protein
MLRVVQQVVDQVASARPQAMRADDSWSPGNGKSKFSATALLLHSVHHPG